MVNDKLPSCSLSELLAQVRLVLADSFADSYWVRAETSDVRVNASSGHCYLEFVEKNSSTNQLIAKAREDMERAAKSLDFLAAARYRDRMYELQKLKEEAR